MIHRRRHAYSGIHSTMPAEEIGEAPARHSDDIETEIEQEQKKTYMEFIYRLMARMDMESLGRMLDKAIDEIR